MASIGSIFWTILGALLIAVGVFGNLLAVIAVWKKRALRSTANYLLVNIAIADVICLTFLPLMMIENKLTFQTGPWPDFLCKFIMSFHVPLTSSSASILTLVVLSVERYHAVVKPMETGIRLREDTVKYAIIAVWITAILSTLPFYIFSFYNSFFQCDYDLESEYQGIYLTILLVTIVFLPFFVISFCYFQIVRELYFRNKVEPQNVAAAEDARVKRKLVKLALSITLPFVLCFFPLAITLILGKLYGKFTGKAYAYTGSIFALESVLNPFLYTFQSANFRQAFKEMFKLSR